MDGADEQLKIATGFDHNWVLNGASPAVRVVEPESGRTLEVETTEPGVQFYSGNFMKGTMPSRQGGLYLRRGGFCLETQHFPDSPNEPGFPSTVLRVGSVYRTETTYRFGVVAERVKEDKRQYVAGVVLVRCSFKKQIPFGDDKDREQTPIPFGNDKQGATAHQPIVVDLVTEFSA